VPAGPSEAPLVSVVVPTRGGRGYLDAALASIRAQTMRDFEVCVVLDDPGSVAPPPLPDDPRFHLQRSGGVGAAAARNRGIATTRAAIIGFLDDDDLWEPTKLERQLAALTAAPEREVVVCRHRRRIEATGEVEPVDLPPAIDVRRLLRSTFFGCSIPLVRRASLLAVGGFDESLAGSHDRDLWLRLRRRGEFIAVDETLATVRVHGSQLSSELGQKIEAKRRLLTKHAVDYRLHPPEHAHQLTRLGMMESAAGRSWRAAACFARAALRDRQRREARALLLEALGSPRRQRRRLLREGFRRYGEIVHFW